jgi:hypothetical protein
MEAVNWFVPFLAGIGAVFLGPRIFRWLFREGYALLFLVGNGGPLPYLRYLKERILGREPN